VRRPISTRVQHTHTGVEAMLRNMILGLAMAASLTLVGGNAVAAEPTLHQVYQAAEAGNYREAQSMMNEVLRNHPNSAKAHFVEAELLAKEGRFSSARTELATAEQLEPGPPFANPAAVQELKARLTPSAGQLRALGVPSTAGSSFPWGMLLLIGGLVVVILVVARAMRQRSAYAAQSAGLPNSGGGAGAMQPYGVGGMGPIPPAGGMGSGILGGLATGAAVGAGVVAGEALMHHVLDGNRSEGALAPNESAAWDGSQPQADQYDMGGSDFGVADASSWDDGSLGGGGDWS